MEKPDKQAGELIISKKVRNGREKILVSLNPKGILEALLCFLMQFAGVFASMSPFGIAFFASVFKPESWILNYAMSLLGTIMAGQKTFWGYAACITCVTIVFALFEKITARTSYKAFAAALIFASIMAVRYISSAFSAFDIFALILESMLLAGSVFMFEKGYRVLTDFKTRKFISESESILTYTFIAVAIKALSKIPQPFGVNLAQVASIVIIYIMCMNAHKGSLLTFAVIFGAVGVSGGGDNAVSFGAYSFGALLGSAFRQYGKVGVVLGFMIANTAASLFMADTNEIAISVTSSLTAAVIFGFIPQKVTAFFADFSAKACIYDTVRTGLSCENNSSVKRLFHIAESIGELGDIYEKASKEKVVGQGYMKMMSGEISAKVCMGCKNRDDCFTSNGPATEAIENMWKNDVQRVSVMTLPKTFRQKCVRCDRFLEAARGSVQVMKTEKLWLSKLNESRKLIACQLKSISDIVKGECEKASLSRDKEMEMKLWTELDSVALTPCEVFIRKSDASFEAEIGFHAQNLSKEMKKSIADAVEKTLCYPIRFGGIKRSGSNIYISFVPLGTYRASFGYAQRSKNGEKVSGDSFNVICANSSGAVMALSDGMGSGERAKEESMAVINMLEKFLHAGFQLENAVKLINSSLLLRGEKDSFATLDICDISLEDATLSFTKLGACTSYIKTADSTLQVKGESLPAGIIRDVKSKKHMLPFSSDALVVLISDGVADIALKNPEYEGWIEEELEKLWGTSPQIVAGKLLDRAKKLSGVVHDDMTVLVACISR